MLSVIEDKAAYCKRFGITIVEGQWDCAGMLPGTLVTDKGSEYASQNFEQIAELGVTVVNLPAYRPELKGVVEKFFDLIQSAFKPHLKGKGVIEPDYQERGAHDYRKDACLTMEQFDKVVLNCILYCNGKRIIENYPYTDDMLQRAIDIVRSFEPPEGYYLADSGGKDSTATKAILRMAGVKFDSHYNVTTVDPPELVCFVIRQYEAVIYDMTDGTHKYFIVQDTGKLLLPVSPDAVVGKRTIHFSIPKYTMRELIVNKQFPPTRLARYCCEKLKEANGEGRVVVTGVRWAESLRRKNNQGLVTIFNGKAAKVAEEQGARYTDNRARGIIMNYDDDAARRTVELCYRTNKTIVNPIIDWTDEDVWEFLRSYKIPYCELYDEGFKRLGCIGCPLGGPHSQKPELERWPQYRKLYVGAFEKMIEARRKAGKTEHATLWNTGEDVMRWWMGCDAKRDPDQMFMPLDEAG